MGKNEVDLAGPFHTGKLVHWGRSCQAAGVDLVFAPLVHKCGSCNEPSQVGEQESARRAGNWGL